MKYFLILWVCSFGNPIECGPAMQSPIIYNSWSECSKGAYIESWNILNKMKPELIDEHRIGTRYTCKVNRPI